MSSDAYASLHRAVIGAMDLAVCSGCDRCGLRCTDGVPMSRDEYDAVRDYIRPAERAGRVVDLARQDRAVSVGDDVTFQACRFRDAAGGSCAVYPVRPLVCRLLGHVEWMPCPTGTVAATVDTTQALALMREYAAGPLRTFEQWEQLLGDRP